MNQGKCHLYVSLRGRNIHLEEMNEINSRPENSRCLDRSFDE